MRTRIFRNERKTSLTYRVNRPYSDDRIRRFIVGEIARGVCAIGMLVVLTAGLSAAGFRSSAAATGSQTFVAGADAYVSESRPNTNYGTATKLRVQNAPVLRA